MSEWVALLGASARCSQLRPLTDVKVSENGISNGIDGARGGVRVVVRHRCLFGPHRMLVSTQCSPELSPARSKVLGRREPTWKDGSFEGSK